MTELTNSFHHTRATVRAAVGQTVSFASYTRVRRSLCGMKDCQCGNPDGTRDSRYSLVLGRNGAYGQLRARVVDNQKEG